MKNSKAKKNKTKITKETQASRQERLQQGFKARPCIIPNKKDKSKSRKVKHKGRMFDE